MGPDAALSSARRETSYDSQPLTDASRSLGRLIHPVDPQAFERDYLGRQVLVVKRASPDYHVDLLSLEQVDVVLGTHALRPPDINVVQSGRELRSTDFLSPAGVLDPLRAARLFAEGATVVFSHLQQKVPSLAHLCNALSKDLSSRMQTNIYLTPAGAQGFAPHWDNHDVFVLQISGSKSWTIYQTNCALPLRGQNFDPSVWEVGAVAQEFQLNAGDTAYIPRGLMHAARSTDEVSLHVTLGLLAYTWADVLVEGVAAAALASPSLRESLPLGFADPKFPAQEKARLLEQKLATVAEHLRAQSPFHHLSSQLIAGHRPCCTNLIAQVVGSARLGLDSVMRARPDAAVEYQESDETCAVDCHGNHLEFPRFASPAVRFVLERPRFTIREIPDAVDDAGKLNLVRRLVKEGLLECLST